MPVPVRPAVPRDLPSVQVVEEARHRGHTRLTLRTFADVPFNAPFYASLGFVETEPETDFHRALVGAEHLVGLDRYGRRIQMTLAL